MDEQDIDRVEQKMKKWFKEVDGFLDFLVPIALVILFAIFVVWVVTAIGSSYGLFGLFVFTLIMIVGREF